jgi:hypothetical protein
MMMKRFSRLAGGGVFPGGALAAGGIVLGVLLFASCELYSFGRLGGADQTLQYGPGDALFDQVMGFLSEPSGVWYSHYAGMGRLDGYRAGRFGAGAADFDRIMGAKVDLFPARGHDAISGASVQAGDYFVFYDDTVFRQNDSGEGGNGGWAFRYIGVVRAVNVFNNSPDRGAIIIEYLEGCAPGWLDRWPASAHEQKPFFGIYYRVLDRDTVQMANAVDLAAMYAGRPYYTEQASLGEAIAINSVENEAEFISWGVVIPQDREK